MSKMIFILSFCLIAQFPVLLIAQTTDNRPTAAVLNFEAQEVAESTAIILTEYFRNEISTTRKFRILAREKMEDIMKEQKLSTTGTCTTTQCIVKIGGILSVQKMFAGTVSKLGDIYAVTVKIINVETSEIESSQNQKGKFTEEELIEVVKTLARRMSVVGTESELQPTKQSLQEPTTEKKLTGTLTITTEPPGASVYLDATIAGETPTTIKVEEGTHEVVLELDGYINEHETVQIMTDRPNVLSKILKIQTGSLRIKSIPDSADIYINDKFYGKTSAEWFVMPNLPIGMYSITLKKENYFDNTGKGLVEYKGVRDIEFTLSPRPGKILVTSTPNKATIYLDDEYKGKTTLTIPDISSGIHKIKITLQGYHDRVTSIEVTPNGSHTINEVLEKIPERGKIKKYALPTGNNINKQLSLGLNYPGVSLKVGLLNNFAIEGRGQFAEYISTYGGRVYWYLNPKSLFMIYCGGEYDFINFKKNTIERNGNYYGGFAGVELFLNSIVSLNLDIGQGWLTFRDNKTTISITNDYNVMNIGLNLYLSSLMNKK